MSLFGSVHRLIEGTYALGSRLEAPERFVIGDRGLVALYAARRAEGRELSRPGEAMLLVSGEPERPAVRLYYPDRLIENLERNDPRRGLSDANLLDFACFVEELDHLLLVAAAAHRGRSLRAIELELHANVTKMLLVGLFLARTLGLPRLTEPLRTALWDELFERGEYRREKPALRQRYRDARRGAAGFLRRLSRSPLEERPALLRRFSRSPLEDKLRLCA